MNWNWNAYQFKKNSAFGEPDRFIQDLYSWNEKNYNVLQPNPLWARWQWTHLSTFKHCKIRSFLLELLNEHLHRLLSDGFLHLNVCLCSQWVYFKAKDSCSCVLPDLKDLRGAIQTDLRLFGCLQAASPPTSSSVIPKASQHTFRLVRLMLKSLHWRITKKTRLLSFFYSFFVFHVVQIE